jgi:hypothetical protein
MRRSFLNWTSTVDLDREEVDLVEARLNCEIVEASEWSREAFVLELDLNRRP